MTDTYDWAGAVGDVWAAEWRRADRTFAGLAPQLNAAALDAAPVSTRVAVDIGCGAGVTSIAIADALRDVQVTGIDLSPGLIEVARDRAAAIPNLRFVNAAVEQAVAAVAPVDLYVSRHGVMFFDDPVAAFRALYDAASPGAAILFSCFRAPVFNPWAAELIQAIGVQSAPSQGYTPGPFAFADPEFVGGILRNAGWIDAACAPADFAYLAGEGDDPVSDAVDFFSRIGPAASALRATAEADRAGVIERITAVCRAHCADGAVEFPAAAWLWSAHKPEAD